MYVVVETWTAKREFLEAPVKFSGWYTWFEQVNVLEELRTVEAIAAEHLALEGEDGH